MSRSGYTDYCCDDPLQHGRWRGMVKSSIKGKRGQALLRELADGMDAMPVKELIEGELQEGNHVCALGVVGQRRGIDMSKIDPDDSEYVASVFNIATCLAQEIVYINDECCIGPETPEQRWKRVRAWVANQLLTTTED